MRYRPAMSLPGRKRSSLTMEAEVRESERDEVRAEARGGFAGMGEVAVAP